MPKQDAYGSQDYIEDALDILRGQNIFFALVIGVPGENLSRTFTSERMEEEDLAEAAKLMVTALDIVAEN